MDYMNDFTLPGVMGMFNQPNPADSASPYLNQVQQQLPQYFQPYMNAGNNALNGLQGQNGQLTGQLPQLQQQYGNLMNNPTGEMNAIGSTFHSSPGYNWQVGQAQNAANHAASAGGMLGSPAEQQSIAGTVGQMANSDYYNYLNHGLDLYGMGLQGTNNLYNTGYQGMNNLANLGYQASSNLGEDLSSSLLSHAQLAYAGQADQNQAKQGMFGNIASMIGALA